MDNNPEPNSPINPNPAAPTDTPAPTPVAPASEPVAEPAPTPETPVQPTTPAIPIEPTPAPQPAAPVVSAPAQPVAPAKKNNGLIIGIIAGASALVVATIGIIIAVILLKVDYSEAYKVAKELKPEVSTVYQGISCMRTLDYVDSVYTSPSSYNDYADECYEAIVKVQDLTPKLGATAGVRKNSEIKAQFEKFSTGLNETLPSADGLKARFDIYKAWHEFKYIGDDIRTSSADSEVAAAVAPLINSGNAVLKAYGEGWQASVLALNQAYRTYDSLSYSDPNKSSARVAYQDAQASHKNWVAANKPNINQLGGLEFNKSSQMASEWNKLYDLISETYAENYNSGSGDCSEFLGAVYCD